MATIVQQTNGEKTIYTADEYTLVNQKLGDLTKLSTSDKTSVVNAINGNAAQLADIAIDAVSKYGADPTGSSDSTTAIQNALDYAKDNHLLVFLPAGTYLITKTLNVYNGTQIAGNTFYQYPSGYGQDPKATTLLFQPSTQQDLFNFMPNNNTSGFLFHISVRNLYIKGNTSGGTTLSRYAFNLNTVIYGNFENLGIENFQASFYCTKTINNRFENIQMTNNSTACVIYAGQNETSDVWSQCTYFGSPIGIQTLGSTIDIRLQSCLLEQIGNFGFDLAKETIHFSVFNTYTEDVPFNNTSTNAVFRLGSLGTTLVTENQLIVVGGSYKGRNAGIVGSFLSADYCNGVLLSAVSISRFTNIILTTSNTRASSIVVQGIAGISWTTFANDLTKICGIYPNGVVNSGSNNHRGSLEKLYTKSINDDGTSVNIGGNLVQLGKTSSGGAVYPNVDNGTALGLSSNRWSTVYAGTSTISTSDRNEKQQIDDISETEKQVASQLKSMMKKYKFNDAVNEKGDKARIHFGIIAQDVEDCFNSHGLISEDYGVFCSDTWYEKDGKTLNENGEPFTKDDDGVLEKTRLGVRYEELLCFIIASL